MTETATQAVDSGPLIRDWPLIDIVPPIETGSIHLWRLDLDGEMPAADVWSMLSTEERRRALSIKNPAIKRTYERVRAAKRRVLCGYLGVDPAQLDLDTGRKGKPFIQYPVTDLQFNLTHTADLTLLAVTLGGGIGLDVEQLRPRKGLLRIAERMFGTAQAEYLRGLDDDERQRCFHVLWTRLEAGVKACGEGLFDNAHRINDGLDLTTFVPQAGYQACVAVPGQCPEPAFWQTMTYRV